MRRRTAAAGGAAAVGVCVLGLLALGPGGLTGDTTDGAGPRAGRAGPGAPPSPDADSAVRAAQRAVDRDPKDPVAWSGLAQAEIERARTTLDTGRLDAAGKALRRSLALRPEDNYAAVTGKGQLANARHEFTEGRAYGLRGTRMAPERPGGYGVLADAEIQLGHYRAARTAVQRMLDLAPTAAAYSRAAYDLETHGRVRDAAVALRRAERSAETPGETAFAEARLGELAWSQGEVVRAQRHFRRAVRVVPGHPYGASGLARVHAAHGRTDRALALYDRLAARTPLPQFLAEATELRLAEHPGGQRGKRVGAGQHAALEAQLKMVRDQGGTVDPHLALYEADHGDPGRAVGLLRDEWKRSRGVIVADALGWALHRAGHDEEALTYARQAARTGWKSALFRYHRGAIEHALGRPEADRHLGQALALNPHFSPYHAPKAVKMLGGRESAACARVCPGKTQGGPGRDAQARGAEKGDHS